MKIRVCIPFYSEFESTKPGLLELKACQEHEFYIEPRQGTYPKGAVRNHLTTDAGIAQKRNNLVDDGVPGVLDFDAFLFVDSDISFTLSDVLKLIEWDKDIVGSPYRSQGDPGYEVGLWSTPGRIKSRYPKDMSGIKEVDWIGAGFLLVKREVFEKLQYPWFRHTLVDMDGYQEEVGEDLSFCLLAQSAGFKVYCNFETPVQHRIRNHSDIDWALKEKIMSENQETQQTVQVPITIAPKILNLTNVLSAMSQDYDNLFKLFQGLQDKNAELEGELKVANKLIEEYKTPMGRGLKK